MKKLSLIAIALGCAMVITSQNSFAAVNSDFNPIAVEKVDNLPDDFIFGMDVSSFITEINSGVVYKDFNGKPLSQQGFFDLLKDSGTNYIRIRVFNDPKDKNGNYYGGGNNDVNTAIKIGKLATKSGMKVLIDFHYSDFWADPKKQMAPKAWAKLDLNQKADATYKFTKDALTKLIKSGVNVTMVQIGNENNNGVAGETEWSNRARIFASGSKAIRDVSKDLKKDILIAVHYAQPSVKYYDEVATQLNIRAVDYDVFATSYYPYWHGDYENLKETLSNISSKFKKKVMVVETSYVNTYEDGDGFSNTEGKDNKTDVREFKVSPQGQANSLRGIVNALSEVPNAIGIMYWEPAWLPPKPMTKDEALNKKIYKHNRDIQEKHGSGWASKAAGSYDAKDAGKYYGGTAVDNEALFDFDGHPLPSLNTYKYIRTGTNVPVVVEKVETDLAVLKYDGTFTLPKDARVIFNTERKELTPIVWNKYDIEDIKKDPNYELTGTVPFNGKNYPISTKVKKISENFLKNPGFETKDDWNIDGNGIAIKDEASNVRTGKQSLKFWDNQKLKFKATQEVTLNKGTYTFGGFMEGGDAGNNPNITLSLKTPDETYTVKGTVTSWAEWHEPKLDNVSIKDDNTKVEFIIEAQLPSGAWGAFDDMYIQKND